MKENQPSLSILIPTYDRPLFLRRVLQYYRYVCCSCPIIVADSSPATTLEANRSFIATLHDCLDITHRVFDATTVFYFKLNAILEEIDSTYVVLCADDDFIVPATLTKCATFLEANEDYAVAHGTALYFAQEEISASPYPYLLGNYLQRSIEYTEPSQRLLDHLSNYSTTFYSVHHRVKYLNNIRLASGMQTDYTFQEILLSCLDIIQGKTISLPDLYMVRESHQARASHSSPSGSNTPTNDDFSRQYVKTRNIVANVLAEATELSFEESQRLFNEAYMTYLSCLMPVLCSSLPQETGLSVTAKRIEAFTQILPFALRTALLGDLPFARSPREAYHILREKYVRHEKFALLRSVLDPHSPYYVDFLPIHQQILKS